MNQSLNPSWRVLLPAMLGGTELPDPESTAAYKLAVTDPEVQRLLAACVNELVQLVQEAGADHFATAAVQGAATLDATTPAQWLETQIGMLRAEIDAAKKERATAMQRRRAEAERRRPLVDAVNRVGAGASAERQALVRHLEALRGNGPRRSRWNELRSVGLTEEQIAKLDLPSQDTDEDHQREKLRRRIAELDAQLAKIRTYGEDPLHDPEHVRGLGFDDIVDTQVAAATAAA